MKTINIYVYICAVYRVYGEGDVDYQECQKWFAEFCVWDISLNDVP